ncbi:MAG TPA: hypothetical protein DCF71_17915 [Gemmatimonadetes bacterium]|nr:hypothetical protein [Gemmatimonadota bacterium]
MYEGREEVQDRLAGRINDLGTLLCAKVGGRRGAGAKLHSPVIVSLGQNVEYSGSSVGCSIGPIAAETDLSVYFVGG